MTPTEHDDTAAGTEAAPDVAAIRTLAALRDITVPPVKFGNASASVTREGYVLDSADIGRKYGFADGDCPDLIGDMVRDWFNDDTVFVENSVWHPILFSMVTTRLLPAIGAPDLPVYMLDGYHHNPIRIDDTGLTDVTVPAGTVTVDWMDLFARVVAAMPDRRILSADEREEQEYGGFS